MPIGKPYTGEQIDDLLGTLGILSMMDWYIDLQPQVQKLEALVGTVGRHASFIKLLATASGQMHAQVCNILCCLYACQLTHSDKT
jgi:hypothetical protein